MKLTDDEKNDIINQFLNDPDTTGNAKTLYNNIKKQGHSITLKYISDFLKGTAQKQVATKYQQSGYYIPRYPRQEYQMDILYFIEPDSNLQQYKKYDSIGTKSFKLNKGYKFGLVCIDIFTKYAHVELLKSKTSKETTEATLNIFKKMGRPEMVYTDEGSEFKGEFLEKMIELGVVPVMTMTHASFAERFIQTFKNKLYAYMNRLGIKTYYNIVDKIVNNYNGSYHSAIGMSPKEAILERNEKKVRRNLYTTYLSKKAKLVKRPVLKKGDYVRHLIKRATFSKGYEPSYSKDVLRVLDFGKIYVMLDNGAEFLPNELLKVKPPTEGYVKPKNLYAEGTLEQRLKDLKKSSK